MRLFYQLFLDYFDTLSILYSWQRRFIPDTHCPIGILATAGMECAIVLSVQDASATIPKPAQTVDSGRT